MVILTNILTLIVYLMIIVAACVLAFNWAVDCYFARKAKYVIDMTKYMSVFVLEAAKKIEENKAMVKKNDPPTN